MLASVVEAFPRDSCARPRVPEAGPRTPDQGRVDVIGLVDMRLK